MTKNRPAIPADIKRRVLVESGHRCAIPTCRHIEVDLHHIIPWEKCKEHKYENLIALCPNCHRRADQDEIDRKALRIYKANLRYTHDRFSQFEVDFLFQLYCGPANSGLPLPPYLKIMIIRLLDAGYVTWHEVQSGMMIGNIKTTPDMVAISQTGREYIDSLGFEHDN